jgi:hypothetical protein
MAVVQAGLSWSRVWVGFLEELGALGAGGHEVAGAVVEDSGGRDAVRCVPGVEVADRQVHVIVLFVHRHIRTPELTGCSADAILFAHPRNARG